MVLQNMVDILILRMFGTTNDINYSMIHVHYAKSDNLMGHMNFGIRENGGFFNYFFGLNLVFQYTFCITGILAFKRRRENAQYCNS